jgi:cell wall-associated NlpC family hydrolase
MYVNSQTTNLRQKADKTSQIIKQLSINTQVTVLSTDNGWAYVDVNGTKGYIAETLLSSSKQETSRGTMTERDSTDVKTETKAQTELSNTDTPKETTSSQTGNSIISYAKQFLGCKYVYGGTTTSGFDCSGFTQYVYKHFGVTLNRTAAAQYSNGTSVTNLQAGDLLMFGKSGINHVGIYIGGNTFIHAANPSRGVTIDTLASGYYKTNYVGARRILN